MADTYLRDDFIRLFSSYTISLFGSLLASGVVAWIAVVEVGVSGTELGLLLASASLVAAIVAIVAGSRVDEWHKRRLMVLLDLFAALGLLSLSVALWFGVLTLLHLCFVAALELSVGIIFGAASGPMLKLVAGARLDWANGRKESVFWVAQAAGPPLGGVITSAVGPGWTVAGNAMSFLVSAVVLAGMGTHGAPSAEHSGKLAGTERLLVGLRVVWANQTLRLLYANAMLFGGSIVAGSTVLSLFVLKELGLDAWQYGVVLGVPCIGGVIAGVVSERAVARFGRTTLLRTAGMARTVWLIPIAFVPANEYAIYWLLALQSLLLFSAGLFNPVFATVRLTVTPTERLSAVLSTWGASSRLALPLGMLLGGVLADVLGTRATFLGAGTVCLLSGFLMFFITPSASNATAPSGEPVTTSQAKA